MVLYNDGSKWGKIIDGNVICNPSAIGNCKDMIIAASTMYEREIEEQLISQRLKKNIDYLLYTESRKKIVDVVETSSSIIIVDLIEIRTYGTDDPAYPADKQFKLRRKEISYKKL